MSHRKDDPPDWTTPQDGSAGPGEGFDPAAPQPENVPAGGEPIPHGTPLSPEDYNKLKDEARRGRSPSDVDAQIDPAAC